jgi:hypothetical protein
MPLQTRVSELPAVTGVTGTDLLIMSSSSATKRVSVSQIGAFFTAAGVAGPTGATGANEAYQSATAPSSAPAGATWLDTASGQYFVRYDELWIEVGGKHYP